MVDVLTHLTAGTIAGMTGVLVDYPLDTIKTRMQTRCPNSCSTYLQCATRLYSQGGFHAFYRGLSVPFAAQGAEAAIIFSVYNTALHSFRTADDTQISVDGPASSPAVWHSSCYWKSAACAGLAVSFLLTPVDMVKCNLQTSSNRPHWQQQRHLTVRRLAWNVYANHGLSGFYRGMMGTTIRAVFGNVAYFLSYEQCKQWLAHRTRPATSASSKHLTAEKETNHVVPAWRSMLAGGISGCLYWSVAYPADVVKTQMQVCSKAGKAGFICTFRSFYRRGGVRALYRGWAVTAVRAFLSSAVVFTTYERFSRTMTYLRPPQFSITQRGGCGVTE